MKLRHILGLAIALLVAAPSAVVFAGGVFRCSTGLVQAGLCSAETRGEPPVQVELICWETTQLDELVKGALVHCGYQADVPCEAVRRVGDTAGESRGYLLAAGVVDGDCSAAQLGTAIPNPQPPRHFFRKCISNILAGVSIEDELAVVEANARENRRAVNPKDVTD